MHVHVPVKACEKADSVPAAKVAIPALTTSAYTIKRAKKKDSSLYSLQRAIISHVFREVCTVKLAKKPSYCCCNP